MNLFAKITLFLSLVWYSPGWAQLYPTRTYTLRDGLPQMQVTTTLLDSRGYLWVGTKSGLAKFDGEQFETYSRQDLGLPVYSIWGLAEDSHHRIWIATSQGLIRFDGATFRAFPFLKEMLPGVTRITIDGHDRVWIWNGPDNHRKLYVFERGHYQPVTKFVRGLDSLHVYSFSWDKARKKLWFCADTVHSPNSSRLYYIADNQCEIVADFAPAPGFGLSLHQTNGPLLLREDNGQGTATTLLFLPDATHPAPRPFLQFSGQQGTVLAPAPADVYVSFARTEAVFNYDHNTQTVEKLADIPGNFVTTEAIRRGDRVYVGTEKGLLEIFDNGLRYFSETSAPYVWNVIERPNGHVWWFNYESPPQQFGPVSLLNEPGLTQLMARERPNSKRQWNNFYYHPAYDRHGVLYLPHETGLIAYNGQTWRFLTKPDDGPVLYVYADDRTDRVFVAMAGGFWLFENGKLVRKITRAEGFHDCSFGLCAVADGAEPDVYWLGSGNGLARYNARTNQIQNLPDPNPRFPALGAIGLCRDTQNTLWIAGRNGLLRYDRPTKRVIPVAADIITKDVGFVGMLTDSTLAIGATYGIYLLDLPTFYKSGRVVMRLLNHRTGYVGIEPGQAGFYKDSRGRAWITSSTVLSYIDTRQFHYQPEPLRPIIRSLNNQRLPFAYADSVFTLPGQQQTARIGFEVLGDNRPANTQYAWQVDNGAWSEWQMEPYTVLRDYDGGTHTFRLKARTGGLNEAREQRTTLRFRAEIGWLNNPSFRRSLPFLLFCLVALGLVLLVFVANGRQEVRLAKQQLVEREKEALFLNVQTLQSQLNTHFMFNVLVPLQNLILKNKPDEAARLLVEFSNLVRGFLNSSAIDNGSTRNRSLIEREITLAEEIALLTRYVNFEQLLYRDKITVHFDAASLDGKLNPETVSLPPMLIQPFVENAIKHGLVHKNGTGNLWIRFVGVDETLVCTIEDDGIGREQMRVIHETSRRIYKSLGSDLVQQRVDTLNQLGYNIRIRIDDRQAGGTVVTISIARS